MTSKIASRDSTTPRRLSCAKRIPEEEGEIRHERLVELYLAKDAVRKEVVKTVAQEDNFNTTYEMPCIPPSALAEYQK